MICKCGAKVKPGARSRRNGVFRHRNPADPGRNPGWKALRGPYQAPTDARSQGNSRTFTGAALHALPRSNNIRRSKTLECR